jgi:hypothetical protein
MRIRASILTTALLLAASAAGACTHAGGKLMVDAPKMIPYQAPDVDEITGIDSSETPDEAEAPAAGSAQKPHK